MCIFNGNWKGLLLIYLRFVSYIVQHVRLLLYACYWLIYNLFCLLLHAIFEQKDFKFWRRPVFHFTLYDGRSIQSCCYFLFFFVRKRNTILFFVLLWWWFFCFLCLKKEEEDEEIFHIKRVLFIYMNNTPNKYLNIQE